MKKDPKAFPRSTCSRRTQSNSKAELNQGIRMFENIPDEEEGPDVDQRSLKQKKMKLEETCSVTNHVTISTVSFVLNF